MIPEISWTVPEDAGFVALAGAIVVALLTAALNGHQTKKRRAKETELLFVESQLRDLYAPLNAIARASENTYARYSSVYADVIKKLNEGETLSKDEARNWLLWNANVFQPANRRMRDIMLNNAHLFLTGELPDEALEFISHVQSYEALIPTLIGEELTLTNEIVHYPSGFVEIISADYAVVAERYQKLSEMNGRHLKRPR